MSHPEPVASCEHAGVPQARYQPFRQCAECGLWVLWAWAPGQAEPVPITTPNVPGTIRRLADFAEWLEAEAIRREMAREGGDRELGMEGTGGETPPQRPVPAPADTVHHREDSRVPALSGD